MTDEKSQDELELETLLMKQEALDNKIAKYEAEAVELEKKIQVVRERFAPTKTTKKARKVVKKLPPIPSVGVRPNPDFLKKLTPSPQLATIVGKKPLPRTEVVAKIWDYIKKHNLQNPRNKRNIIADAKLYQVLGQKEITMFDLATLISRHLS